MSFVSLYLYVPDEGSLLPKYRDCTTSNDFELYIYIYVYIYIYMPRHPWRNGNALAPDTQGPGFDSWRVSIFSII